MVSTASLSTKLVRIGAGLLLNDDFDSPNYGASVFNDTLSADQSHNAMRKPA